MKKKEEWREEAELLKIRLMKAMVSFFCDPEGYANEDMPDTDKAQVISGFKGSYWVCCHLLGDWKLPFPIQTIEETFGIDKETWLKAYESLIECDKEIEYLGSREDILRRN